MTFVDFALGWIRNPYIQIGIVVYFGAIVALHVWMKDGPDEP